MKVPETSFELILVTLDSFVESKPRLDQDEHAATHDTWYVLQSWFVFRL